MSARPPLSTRVLALLAEHGPLARGAIGSHLSDVEPEAIEVCLGALASAKRIERVYDPATRKLRLYGLLGSGNLKTAPADEQEEEGGGEGTMSSMTVRELLDLLNEQRERLAQARKTLQARICAKGDLTLADERELARLVDKRRALSACVRTIERVVDGLNPRPRSKQRPPAKGRVETATRQ